MSSFRSKGNDTVLALTSSHVPLVFQNPLSNLVTSLPYIDQDPDPRMQNTINMMIQEEMRNLAEVDYLQTLPLPEFKFEKNETILKEYERIAAGGIIPGLGIENYIPPTLTDKENKDLTKLEEADKRMDAIIEHKNLQLINHELMLKFGPSSWKEYIGDYSQLKNQLDGENTALKVQLDEVNSKRKFEQNNASEKLAGLKYKIDFMLDKNMILEKECANLEQQIFENRKKLIKKF